jgi:hypothetical protein
MLHRIVDARANRDLSVTLTWEEGAVTVADFRPNAEKGGVCAPLRDPDFFVANLRLGDEGYVLAWSDEIEFSADSLWYRAFPEDRARDYPTAAAQ